MKVISHFCLKSDFFCFFSPPLILISKLVYPICEYNNGKGLFSCYGEGLGITENKEIFDIHDYDNGKNEILR